MENRYKLPKGLQKRYLTDVENISGLSKNQIAETLGIVRRSYTDWKREKYTITQKAVEIIEKRFRVKLPYVKNKALNNWLKSKKLASRKGGLAASEKHGGPGTPEGRRKGGKHAMAILRKRGIIPRAKPFHYPEKLSSELAEFIGILLGDGHIGKG